MAAHAPAQAADAAAPAVHGWKSIRQCEHTGRRPVCSAVSPQASPGKPAGVPSLRPCAAGKSGTMGSLEGVWCLKP